MKKISILILALFVALPLPGLCETADEGALAVGRLVKVSRRSLAFYDMGRSRNPLGYQFGYVDKFYTSQKKRPDSETGELFVVEWRCWGISPGGETLRIHFEYQAAGDPAVKKKHLEVYVDRDGLYETSVAHQGAEFLSEGRIESWKVLLLKKDRVLDEKRSGFWAPPLRQNEFLR